MRSLAGKLSLRKKKDPPLEGPPVICELAVPGQIEESHASSSSSQRQGARFEHQQQKKMAYAQDNQFMSQSFSRTQTVSQGKNAGSGRVEVTSTWNFKTAGSNQLNSDDSPYGVTNLPTTFGAQWGMSTSKDTEQTKSPYRNAEFSLFESQYGVKASKGTENVESAYGKADVSLYGPQYGIPALSPDDDLYGDSDEERRNHRSVTVQVVKISTEVKAAEAAMSAPQKNIISESYNRGYNAVGRNYNMMYKDLEREAKPSDIAQMDQSVEPALPLQQNSFLHRVVPGKFRTNPVSIAPKTAESLLDAPITQFADLNGANSSFDDYGYSIDDTDVIVATKTGPTSCIICTDDFSALIKPPAWITISCAHEPSVCCRCMSLCIKNDLESKIWNQITCPECKTLLVYEDIQRLADPNTFAKYEALSFRNAIGKDDNFVWCQNCDFGQLHTGGNEQPIVRCMKCGFRSCFRHTGPWHDRLTCQEYDEMMNDPDGFKSAIERDDEAAALALKQQHEADERMARELEAQDRQEEEDRQKAAHEEELRIAREAQAAEAERIRAEKQERERVKRLQEIKRRKQQEELSLKTVQSTTKNCPGCRWPIEKNHGCSHMTCIKCRSEFCWSCLNDYKAIRKLGNSEHKPTCKFHSDNLPDLDDEEVDRDEDSDSDSD